ncbi:MAG: GAF domain-containing protein [Bacteroidia bacterium]|nr:GAF domain-containing protein [Bacteroidia bacterium]MDW8088223.1 GAF domain-containing protein [Bacteroidia bacterium]
MKKEHTASLFRVARYLVWTVAAAYVANLALALNLPPSCESRTFHLLVEGIGLGLTLGLAYFIHHSSRVIWRILLVFLALAPLMLETALFYPFNGGTLWWSCSAAGYAGILLLEYWRWRTSLFLALSVGGVGLLITLFHDKMAIFPADPLTHGRLRHGILQFAMIIVVILALRMNRNIWQSLEDREARLQEALQLQRETMTSLLEQQRLAQEALGQLERLRAKDQARTKAVEFVSHYETLMRTSYHLTLPEFARKILEHLAEELPVLGGLFYLREGEKGQVIATYAFSDRLGHEVEGGLFRSALLTKKPYVVHPLPSGIALPLSSLPSPRPEALLYLPFFNDATGESVALAELLLSQPPAPEGLERLALLLPRIGTYIWARRTQATAPATA